MRRLAPAGRSGHVSPFRVGAGGRSGGVAARLQRVAAAFAPGGLPVRVRAWDGTVADLGPDPSVSVTVTGPPAVRHMLAAPGQIGLARAYVSGDLTVEGDLEQAMSSLFDVLSPPADGAAVMRRPVPSARLLLDVALLWGSSRPPIAPAVEARLNGRRHTRVRDAVAIAHHYDVGNDFYRLLLGPAMTYSCAYWTRSGLTLAEAQEAKHELIAAKLALTSDTELLDVGCGWGSLLIHAATRHGTRGLGVTLSRAQADLARRRVAEAGVAHLVEIRRQDYRDLTGRHFDAIASVGMAEHVGTSELATYSRHIAQLLRPGGRLLHHTISTRNQRPVEPRQGSRADTFINRYVFPDGQLQPMHATVAAIESSGLEVRDVQSLREHYPRTLRAWTANLRRDFDDAVNHVGVDRARTWELYMTASAIAFDRARVGVNQVLAVRMYPGGVSGMPAARPEAPHPYFLREHSSWTPASVRRGTRVRQGAHPLQVTPGRITQTPQI